MIGEGERKRTYLGRVKVELAQLHHKLSPSERRDINWE